MTQSSPDPLRVARRALRILITLNWLMGLLIVVLFVASIVASKWTMTALGVLSDEANAALVIGMRLIMVIGIVAVPITYIVLNRLLAIVDSVSAGDAFVIDNAERLKKIAWAILVLELLHIVVVIVAANVSTSRTPLDVGDALSITRWLAVVLLFVLAQVFELGARMRDDLEGTV